MMLYLCIEEHMLANGQAQSVLRSLKPKSEQPGIVRQHDLLCKLEWDFLLGIQCPLSVAPTPYPKLALIVHFLHKHQWCFMSINTS